MDSTTNNEETPRPEPKGFNRWAAAAYGWDEEDAEPTATGYEADEDHALYWDQHAEG
jgi:hypothetical protein